MRKHTIEIKATPEGNIILQIHAPAGEIADTICDTVMSYNDADNLFGQLSDAMLDLTEQGFCRQPE